MLEEGVDPDPVAKHYPLTFVAATPLHIACYQGDLEATRQLLNYGADADGPKCRQQDTYYFQYTDEELDELLKLNYHVESTPLHLACGLGHEAVAKLLLEKGAAVDAADNVERTPLHRAC